MRIIAIDPLHFLFYAKLKFLLIGSTHPQPPLPNAHTLCLFSAFIFVMVVHLSCIFHSSPLFERHFTALASFCGVLRGVVGAVGGVKARDEEGERANLAIRRYNTFFAFDMPQSKARFKPQLTHPPNTHRDRRTSSRGCRPLRRRWHRQVMLARTSTFIAQGRLSFHACCSCPAAHKRCRVRGSRGGGVHRKGGTRRGIS